MFFVFIFISISISVFTAVKKSVSVSAEDESSVSSEANDALNENINDLLGQLDLKALEEYVNSLNEFNDESVGDRLLRYVKGEAFDYEGFGEQILEILFVKVREILPSFACIAAVTLLSGIISSLRSGTLKNSSAEMIFLVSYAAALIPLIGVLTQCFQESIGSVSQMKKQMQIVFPLMLTLMAASGGSISVAVCRPAVAFFSTNIVSVITSVVFPITITVIAFSMAANLTRELRISKFGSFFKSINKWIIGICISVFGLFFSVQGITSATYDGIVRRATKYAIGNGIPIVGGFLSGGFDLAVAGSVLIKNSLGSMSIFLMISVVFEPLILLLSVNLFLRLTAAITQPFGDSRLSDFLGETAENLNYCTAGLLFVAFLYFLSVVLLVTSTEVLF